MLHDNISKFFMCAGKLGCIWGMLGKFLSMLAVLDTALGHPALQHGWLQYKRMVKAHRNEPDRFGVSLEAVRNLETVLLKLEDTVVTGRLLERYSTVQYSTVQYMLDRVLGARLDPGGRPLLEELTAWLRSLRWAISNTTARC